MRLTRVLSVPVSRAFTWCTSGIEVRCAIERWETMPLAIQRTREKLRRKLGLFLHHPMVDNAVGGDLTVESIFDFERDFSGFVLVGFDGD